MSVYAIGDVQGCLDDLKRLLEKLNFDVRRDTLWFTGDLVNRGPKSLETLRFVKSLGDAAVTVLGNHDLHLIAVSLNVRKAHKKDTLEAVLKAPDRDELIAWLRHRPLFHYDGDYCLLHAGVPPQWDFALTAELAQEAEEVLRSENFKAFFFEMYNDEPAQWSSELRGTEKIRFIVNCLTRMRYCDASGRLDLKEKGAPGTQPKHLLPWFQIPNRKSTAMKIIFGHWSTLGYYQGSHCLAIDTGCLWGGALTAVRLAALPEKISVSCRGEAAIV